MAAIDNVQLYPQDFSLDTCKIVTALAQPTEIRPIVLYFNYYEDLYNNFITGDITINDSIGLLSSLSITGQDYLILGFSKPGGTQKLEKTFRIFKITDRHIVNNQNENYTLHFCSEEAILSEQYKVSKSYNNMKVSDIVYNIANTQLAIANSKFLTTNVEPTKGVRNLIIPSMKPFEAINWLCTQAISDKTKTVGSTYFFYENLYGYNFKSLQALYTNPVYDVYKYEPKNLTMPDDPRLQDLSSEAKNVIGYEVVSNFNSLGMITHGAYANRLIAIDLLSLKYTVNDFDYLKYYGQGESLNQYPLLANNQNRFVQNANTTYQAVLKTSVTNTGDSTYNAYIKKRQPSIKDVNVESTIPYRTAQIPEINAIKYKISIPGDPYMTVGNIITFNLPEIVRTSDDRETDKYYSGNYLVTAVRHSIDVENKFVTMMEISKESLPNPYPNPDNTLSAWKAIRSK